MNEFNIIDDTVYILLKGRSTDNYAMVSLNKWNLVSKYKWYLGKAGYPICYELGKITLHRFIFTIILEQKIPSNIYIDHIDRNKLNNTDSNLRLATPQENSFNRTSRDNKKGVKKISENNYTAGITKNGIRYNIPNIASEQEAANIYNLMAEELFGDFASYNKF